MIYGIGIDVIQPHRVARLLEKYGERFVQRVLTPLELPRYEKAKQHQQVLFGLPPRRLFPRPWVPVSVTR
jgi:phosphopantetheinyl transferase (holo-ACP synthase)